MSMIAYPIPIILKIRTQDIGEKYDNNQESDESEKKRK